MLYKKGSERASRSVNLLEHECSIAGWRCSDLHTERLPETAQGHRRSGNGRACGSLREGQWSRTTGTATIPRFSAFLAAFFGQAYVVSFNTLTERLAERAPFCFSTKLFRDRHSTQSGLCSSAWQFEHSNRHFFASTSITSHRRLERMRMSS